MSDKNHTDLSFNKYAWIQFKRNKPAYISLYILFFLIVIAILAPVLANERPLYCKYKGEDLFPAFSFKNNYEITANGKTEKIQLDIGDWKQLELEKVIWAPIPYSPAKSDLLNANHRGPKDQQKFKNASGEIVDMPARFRHVLGTTGMGNDVMAGLIHGARISLSIGVISMSIASLIGILLGSLAGYFGDTKLLTSRGRFWFVVIGIIVAWFYAFQSRSFTMRDAIENGPLSMILQILISIIIFSGVVFIFSFAGKYIGKIRWLNKKVHIPVDAIVSRSIEIIHSLPIFILIISLAAIAKPSLINIMLIIGVTSWTGIARFTRAEFLRIRNLEYIQAAKSLGYSEIKIIFKHALPNGLAPALVSIAFGIASAILVEASLSFLGIGVPPGTVTWGSLVNDGRANFSAWWLVIFPGLAIFITVTVYNLIGEGLRDALDPKLKR
ncbi:MAG: ABC transporter permease [Chitinophagales bacterium]|nr:ABC transporter permease [Chitinophagales bacterium]